jgi:hypothetical protein
MLAPIEVTERAAEAREVLERRRYGRSARLLILLGVVGSADLAAAQGYFFPCNDLVASQSTVNLAENYLGPPLPPPAAGSQSDGPRFGDPTSSSIQRGYSNVSSAIARAALAIGSGGFSSQSSVGNDNQQALAATGGGAEGCYGDTVTIGGGSGSGTLVLPVHIVGSLFATYVIPGPPPANPVVEAGISVMCKTLTSSCGDYEANTQTPTTPPDNQVEPVDDQLEMRIPFVFGEATQFFERVFTSAAVGFTAIGGGVRAETDLTGTLGAATVLDQADQVVPGATIQSDLGVDYFAPVPEPESRALAAAVVLVLGLRSAGVRPRASRA